MTSEIEPTLTKICTRGNVLCAGILMEMQRFKYRAGKEDLGAVALVLDLAKALERVSLPVVWTWATHFSFLRKVLRGAVW